MEVGVGYTREARRGQSKRPVPWGAKVIALRASRYWLKRSPSPGDRGGHEDNRASQSTWAPGRE
eukprot:5247459-Pyramimonas_sp.AAC.1